MQTSLFQRFIVTVTAAAVLSGCGWMAEQLVDNVAGVPVSDVARGMKQSSDEHNDEARQQRVDELEAELEAFRNESDNEEDAGQSVVIRTDANEPG